MEDKLFKKFSLIDLIPERMWDLTNKQWAAVICLGAVLAVVLLSLVVGKTAACIIVGSLMGFASIRSFLEAGKCLSSTNSGHTAGLFDGFAGLAFAMLGFVTGAISVVCFLTALV